MPAVAPSRAGRRRAGLLVLPAVALLVCTLHLPAATVATAQAPAAGMLVTLSATYEEQDGAGGIVIRITLDNQTGGDVSGLSVGGMLPQQTRIVDAGREKAGPAPTQRRSGKPRRGGSC